jgi:hypothetical protein
MVWGQPHHPFGNRAEQHAPPPGHPVCCDHDQIRVFMFGNAHNLARRITMAHDGADSCVSRRQLTG